MNDREQDDGFQRYGVEGQTLEFKESLNRGSKLEAVRSLVAFVNASGGSVVFGVADDGRVKGLQLGQKTCEDFANFVPQHTYPPLQVRIAVERSAGMDVMRVETSQDRPPLTGCYMRSEEAIQPGEPVDARKLEAFRRVGPTDQKADFMLLRRPDSNAPDIVVTRQGAMTRGGVLPRSWSFSYQNVGARWAFHPEFDVSGPLTVSAPQIDLAPNVKPLEGTLNCPDGNVEIPYEPIVLGVTYGDGDIRWRSTVELVRDSKTGYELRRRTRRIVEFPSQRAFRGD